VRALRLSFDKRTGAGFFLRAESWFNAVSHIDELDKEPANAPPISAYYGGRSLHTRSHGETFFTVLDLKFRRNGLFLLDEPEAALSPQRQLSFLVLIHDVLRKRRSVYCVNTLSDAVGVSGRSDLLIRWDRIAEISYEETAPLQIVRHFLNHREGFLRELFAERPLLFGQSTG
jgi:predicted ATPase